MTYKITLRFLCLLFTLLLLTCPFLLRMIGLGEGSDDKVVYLVSNIAPSYHPWIESFGVKFGDTAEPYLFALQIFIGLLLFALSYWLLKGKLAKENK